MNIRNLISNLIAQISQKNYANANKALDVIVTEKVKTRIKNAAEKQKSPAKKATVKKVVKKTTKKNK